MYRSYENPRRMEELLEEAQKRLSDAIARGDDDCIDLYQEVEELKERVNFAWQDDEF